MRCSCIIIHHLGLAVCFGKYNYHDSLKARLRGNCHLTIIPQARAGYEMVDSQRGPYPTSATGIIVLLKIPPKI